MKQPLTEWYCDCCGQPITSAQNGYVIWKNDANYKAHGFKIVHQAKCDTNRREYPSSSALSDFLGADGMAKLLAMMSLGPIKKNIGQGSHCDVSDMDEFVDFFRRVQLPYYEEARTKFADPNLLHDFSDSNEVAPYLGQRLKRIITDY